MKKLSSQPGNFSSRYHKFSVFTVGLFSKYLQPLLATLTDQTNKREKDSHKASEILFLSLSRDY